MEVNDFPYSGQNPYLLVTTRRDIHTRDSGSLFIDCNEIVTGALRISYLHQ
jgi:hypothetical protein